MGKTHSKPLAARHGRGTAWARHAMCESALNHHQSVLFDWNGIRMLLRPSFCHPSVSSSAFSRVSLWLQWTDLHEI